MSVSTYIRIDAECHSRHLVAFLGDIVNHLKFGSTLHVEAEDVFVYAQLYFPIALSNSCIYNLLCRKTSIEGSLYLPSTHAIHAEACLANDAQHLRIGIRLNGIMHAETIILAGLASYLRQRVTQQFGVVVVEWGGDRVELVNWEYTFHVLYLLNNVSERLWRALFLSASRMRNEML